MDSGSRMPVARDADRQDMVGRHRRRARRHLAAMALDSLRDYDMRLTSPGMCA